MGILNVTPDSFSDGGEFLEPERAVERALRMEDEGADIIDIGAESTRPGADPVPIEEQLVRLERILKSLAGRLCVPVSIDTASSRVARVCLELGACIINDISALRFDPDLAGVAAEFNAGLILMHMQGTPRTMQIAPKYTDVMAEVVEFLSQAKKTALKAGVKEECLAVDPGIGFGKIGEDNLRLIRELACLRSLDRPVVLGTSRKSFIGKLLGGVGVKDREFGTAASICVPVFAGSADVVRVHDVKHMRETILMARALSGREEVKV